jgi:Rrf2 family protein
MRVPQSLDYALRALVELAKAPEGEWTVAGDIANRLGMPRRFVEQQITALAKSGIVRCRRGVGGGCTVARTLEDVTVADVVRALEGAVLDVPHVAGSAVSELWEQVADGLGDRLAAISLDALVTRQKELESQTGTMYWI